MLRKFKDADAAVEAISGVDMQVDVAAAALGTWRIGEIELANGVRIDVGHMAAPYAGLGASGPRSVFVAWSLRADEAPWSLNGLSISPSDIAILAPGAEYAVSATRPLHWASVVLPVVEWARIAGDSPRGVAVRAVAPDVARMARAIGRDAMHAARAGIQPDARQWQAHVDHLVGALTCAGRTARQSFRREMLVVRAIDFLRGHATEVLDVEHLCSALGISERSLRRFFVEQLGMSAGAYLRLRRLNNVRRELCGASPAESVTQVATRHGFYDLGRFARQYQRLFGELPSRTLARERAA